MPRWRTMIDPDVHELAVAGLDAEPLAGAVAAVLDARARLLVRHRLLVLLRARRAWAPHRWWRRRPSPWPWRTTPSARSRPSPSSAFAGRPCRPSGCGLRRLRGCGLRRRRLRVGLRGGRLGGGRLGRGLGGRLRGGLRRLGLSAFSAPTCELRGEGGVLGGLAGGGRLERFCRSVFSRSLALPSASAALLPPKRMSAIRRTVSSWRWPFLTRRRAFGRYLNAMTLSPRSRRAPRPRRPRRRRRGCRRRPRPRRRRGARAPA